MSIAGKLGAVYRSDGNPSVTFTDEATTSNAAHTKYSITNASKRFLDKSAAIVVKKNGTIITTGFNIEYAGGVIVFEVALLGTDVITVSGKYFNIVQCATFFNWKLDSNLDLKDVTTFASNGWKEQLATMKSWSASAEGYWADETFAGLLGVNIIISLFIDATTNKRYEGYIYLKKNSITEPVDDVIKESADIEGTGPLYYHE